MFDLNLIINKAPYSISQAEKEQFYVESLSAITKYHYEHCPEYRRIIDTLYRGETAALSIGDIPFIPVSLFKEYELLSIAKSAVTKTMTSSGTTGQRPSKIFLDKTTAFNQSKVLTKLVSSFTGPKRLPMLVVDTNLVTKDRNLFSARGAGVLGFSMVGYDVTFALTESMTIDLEKVQTFLKKHEGEQILIFGFTSIIWQHLYLELNRLGITLPLERGVMIHGGGWKKLVEQAVDNDALKARIHEVTGVSRIHNYYGMVEQTGSIFIECSEGYLHASLFSDILIRNVSNFEIMPVEEQGLIQLVSLLPLSYPGHSIITEDLGTIVGIDDCPCGRKGKYFKVHGRIKNAEVRGCSDTYEPRK